MELDRGAALKLIQAQQRRNSDGHEVMETHLRFIDSLDEQQLIGLDKLLFSIGVSPEAARMAAYWQGLVTSRTRELYNRCVVCSANHDADLQKLMSMPPDDLQLYFNVRPGVGEEVICVACGSKFENISKRMETPPEPDRGCPGCVAKQAIIIHPHYPGGDHHDDED